MLFPILFITSIATLILVDLYYIFTILPKIREEFIAERWDQLRHDKESGTRVLKKKYEIAQARAKGMMYFEILVRVFLIVLAVRESIQNLVGSDRPLIDNWRIYPSVVFAILILVYVFESRWRMKAILAMAFAMILRLHNVIQNLYLVLISHALQVFFFFILYKLHTDPSANSSMGLSFLIFCLWPFALIVIVLHYFFYKRMETYWFYQALQYLTPNSFNKNNA
jgi:hypothetical protein